MIFDTTWFVCARRYGRALSVGGGAVVLVVAVGCGNSLPANGGTQEPHRVVAESGEPERAPAISAAESAPSVPPPRASSRETVDATEDEADEADDDSTLPALSSTSASTAEHEEHTALQGAPVEPSTPKPAPQVVVKRPQAQVQGNVWGDSQGVGGLTLSGIGQGGGGLGSGQGFGSGQGLGSGQGVSMRRYAGNTEAYAQQDEGSFTAVATDPRSTFSIDVDTASYALVRRHLRDGSLPPSGAVRIEEMINYFDYGYAPPSGPHPFAVHTELSQAPWQPNHQLLRIGLRAKHLDLAARPAANLTFLIDVSGSMSSGDKLELLKRGLLLLIEQLRPIDRVSIVVYAGASGLVLDATAGNEKRVLRAALQRLTSGGSTNGAEGIELAYKQARRWFVPGGTNRVILATDGDFNVGVTSESELVDLIEEKAKGGVFLSVLGFGRGNYKDSTLERLADKGNGNYAYVDGLGEARKVLVEQAAGTLITVAKDVKIQVEFNPRQVAGFRLIGYENRMLQHRDFNDDNKDAGEIGADHTVTALYELVPAGVPVPGANTDGLRYQQPAPPTAAAASNELLTVNLRYKPPAGSQSRKLAIAVPAAPTSLSNTTDDFRFAAAVASFGMLLRGSEFAGQASYDGTRRLAAGATGTDPRRRELLTLIDRAKKLPRR